MSLWPIQRFPYVKYTEINLDWIMRKLKEQISGLVASVNGKTGDVVLDASDVHALPDTYTPPAAPVQSVNTQTGDVVIPVPPSGGTTGQVLAKDSNTDYDYSWQSVAAGGAVDSVNGQTGDVVLDASDVHALPDTYTPPAAPVQSVNTQTGDVVIPVPPSGGNTGQVLTKDSNTDYDYSWQSVPTSPVQAWSYVGQANGGNSEYVNISRATEYLVVFFNSLTTAYRASIVLPFVALSEDNYFGGYPPSTGSPVSCSFFCNSNLGRFQPDSSTIIFVYSR